MLSPALRPLPAPTLRPLGPRAARLAPRPRPMLRTLCPRPPQAASGAGQAAMEELELQTREVLEGKPVTKNIFPFQCVQKTIVLCVFF